MPTILNTDVYFNLHKKVWSLRSRTTGKVTAHTSKMLLKDVDFVVQPAGRQRVIDEGCKNVHAFARAAKGATLQPLRGYGMSQACYDLAKQHATGHTGIPVSYNPYKADFFYETEHGREVKAAEFVRLDVMNDQRPVCIAFGVEYGDRHIAM